MRNLEEQIIEDSIKELNLKNEVVLNKSKEKTVYKSLNFYYSVEAIKTIKKLCRYLDIQKSTLLKNIVIDRPIVKKLNKNDLTLKQLKNIQNTLNSNLTQAKEITKYIKDEKHLFMDLRNEKIRTPKKDMSPEEALQYFLDNTQPTFERFINLKLKEHDDTSEEVLEILEKIKTVKYLCDVNKDLKANPKNRIYLKLKEQEYFLLLNHAIYLNEHKLFLKNKDNVKNKPNLTAALWEKLTKITPQVSTVLITEQELDEIKKQADLFNDAVHKVNYAKINGLDFKSKNIYDTGVALYKKIKSITDKYYGV